MRPEFVSYLFLLGVACIPALYLFALDRAGLLPPREEPKSNPDEDPLP